MRAGWIALIGMLAGLAASPVTAGDIRHDLLGCWDQAPNTATQAYLKQHPGAISSVTLCFKRNGETIMSSVGGGETFDGHKMGLEGMSDTGRYAFSNGRLLVYGMYAFDAYGPLSCVPSFSSANELMLSDCINAFRLPPSRIETLHYQRTRGYDLS